jgi:hypothetical protein
MQSRFVFLASVVFTSMFAGAAVANRLIRPDLSIPNDPNEIRVKSIADNDDDDVRTSQQQQQRKESKSR